MYFFSGRDKERGRELKGKTLLKKTFISTEGKFFFQGPQWRSLKECKTAPHKFLQTTFLLSKLRILGNKPKLTLENLYFTNKCTTFTTCLNSG